MAQRGISAPSSKFIGDRMRLQGDCWVYSTQESMEGCLTS